MSDLENAAEEHANIIYFPIHERHQMYNSFIAGAKWQHDNDRMPVCISSGERQIAALKAENEKLKAEAADFRKCCAGFVGSTVRMAEQIWANTKSQEWIKNKLLEHQTMIELKDLYKKYPGEEALAQGKEEL